MSALGDGRLGDGTLGNAATQAWYPGDPWPTELTGGAQAPAWGGYIRLWIRAGIAAGYPFVMGKHARDRLDAGNVLSGAEVLPRATETERLWIDLSCDALDVEIAGGGTGGQGIFSKADAATLVLTLRDPEGKYDPLNASSPFAYAGHSRLVPGTPIEAFAEVVNASTGDATRHWLFTGTADSWAEEWTPHAYNRQAKVVATDVTKQWVRYDQPEQPPVGAGENTTARVLRLVNYYQWPGTVERVGNSTVTLQATTLAQSGWELLNRTLDDELGYVHFTPEGNLRWCNREAWHTAGDPVLELGCGEGLHDVLIAAQPSTLDAQLRNAVYASRKDGETQAAISVSSQARHGVHDYKRTDLGLETDMQAAEWASDVLSLYAYPQIALENVTMLPAIAPSSWAVWQAALELELVTDVVRIAWAPPDRPENLVDGRVRVVGFKHAITRGAWEIEWALVGVDPLGQSGTVFTMGPHANNYLDAGFVIGFT